MCKKETEKENEKKKKAGYSVGHNAPAMLVTLIDTKLVSAGYAGVEKAKIKDLEKEDGYRKRYAREMYLALK
jgi:purine nucleoside permease